jgi:hypothetical protein
MSESGLFLDYQGPLDFQVMDSLLKKIKKTKEFSSLNKTTGKRVYAVVVECLENIYKFSASRSSDIRGIPPHITVNKLNDKIIIKAGNPIISGARDNLERLLVHINQSDESSLNDTYENIIKGESSKGKNGAGLGLIFMALKSGNKLEYKFNTLNNKYLYFELQISINKYIMRKLVIDQTSFSPKVILDPEKKIFQISGESRPPDVKEFYDKILSWLNEFSLYIIGSDEKENPIVFSFNFEYFNSSSGKLILDMCKVLAGLRQKGVNIIIKWYFEKEDIDMLEVGKEMSRIVRFPFEYVEAGLN